MKQKMLTENRRKLKKREQSENQISNIPIKNTTGISPSRFHFQISLYIALKVNNCAFFLGGETVTPSSTFFQWYRSSPVRVQIG